MEIKQAYRRCALKHHPDRHASATVEDREAEETIFKDVSEAYSVLSDPQKKDRYDNGYDLEDLGGMGELTDSGSCNSHTTVTTTYTGQFANE